jgi:arylformamidase
MTRFVDITRPVDETLALWPGRRRPGHRWEKRIADDHHCNTSVWEMNAHSGTHMDAPLHFIEGGTPIDQVAPQVFVGPCVVVSLREVESQMMDEALAARYRGEQRLLIRTHHSEVSQPGGYAPHERLLTQAAAALLLESGLQLLGTDRLSVDDSGGRDFTLHRQLLGAGCVILEGLLLTDVTPGSYQLYAAPLRLSGTEASPVRALLLAA